MTRFVRSTLAGLAVTAALAVSPASAEMMSFKADLKGASEVPPTTSEGTGNITATYDTASKKLSWKGTVSGLSGNATAAHFHGPAEPGKNGTAPTHPEGSEIHASGSYPNSEASCGLT